MIVQAYTTALIIKKFFMHRLFRIHGAKINTGEDYLRGLFGCKDEMSNTGLQLSAEILAE